MSDIFSQHNRNFIELRDVKWLTELEASAATIGNFNSEENLPLK